MGIILKPTVITGDKSSATVEALFDTGAGASFLRKDIAQRVGTVVVTPTTINFTLGDGKGNLPANEAITLDVTVEGLTIFFTFLVVDELGEEMIIGADMLQRWKIRLDPEQEGVSIDPQVMRLRL